MNKAIFIRNTMLSLILIPCIISIIGLPLLAYGQGSYFSSSSAGSDTMKKQTSGGMLDIILQSFPKRLRVQFLTQGTGTVQPHTDYDITIKDSSGKQVFSASQDAGDPGTPLHAPEGIVIIPYTVQGPGNYTINVAVYGILFNPIKPDSADFTIKVT
ncbi:MAG: hypothetical protein ACJ71H_00325 [Nitrososphaeraceae archaeon]